MMAYSSLSFCVLFFRLFQTGSMEEVPLRINPDERDFEMDESDFLLEPPDHEIRSSTSRYRSAKRFARCLPLLHCGYVSFLS